MTFLFNEYIVALRSEDRIKSAENIEHALRAFKRYKPALYLEDIDTQFLKGYPLRLREEILSKEKVTDEDIEKLKAFLMIMVIYQQVKPLEI